MPIARLPRREVAALAHGMADIARVHAESRVPGMDDGTEERQAVQRELKLTGAVVVRGAIEGFAI